MIYLVIIGLVVLAVIAAALILGRRRGAAKLDRRAATALQLTQYAERLRACAEEIEQPHADVFWDMAGHAERIRAEILADDADLSMARSFVHHHAKLIVNLVEKFVSLHTKARAEHAQRLEEITPQIHGYRDVFARVEKALIDNDFEDMEATMAALDVQLERLAF